MIPNDPKERFTMIKYMIDKLTIEYDELTSWEQNFLESVTEQFEMKATLSDRQCEILERIYDKF